MKKLLIPLAMAVMILGAGCELENWARSKDTPSAAGNPGNDEVIKDGKPHYVISINEIVKYPRAESLEREIPTYDGRNIWINTNPFIHSRNVKAVELLPDPAKKGFYNLKLTLNRRGKLIWMQIAVQFNRRQMALLVDGVLYRAFTPQPLLDDNAGTVVIDGPFDVYTAKAIQRYVTINYKIFNPDEENEN